MNTPISEQMRQEALKLVVNGMLPRWDNKIKPRPHPSYREPRRTTAKVHRALPIWRDHVAGYANYVADIKKRKELAHRATQAAARAMATNRASYTPAAGALAMLEVYLAVKQTRAISRIVRELKKIARVK